MTRTGKTLAVIVVSALGLWGCAQGSGNDSAERVKALENQCAKLESDCKSAVTARDRLRQQVTDLEAERDKLRKDVEAQTALAKDRQALARERDELVQQVGARTTERDAAQGQLDQVRKGLRNLLGQTEAAIGGSQPSAAAVSGGGGKS
jgi:uncharacterized coiled-coil DUF342 family protein